MKILLTTLILACFVILFYENTPFWLEDGSISEKEGFKRFFVVLVLIIWFEVTAYMLWYNELGLIFGG